MASSEQLDFFWQLYEREQERHRTLINRGQVYLTILTLYFAALALDFGDAQSHITASTAGAIGFLIGLFVLSIAMIFIVLAVSIMRHANPCNALAIVTDAEISLCSEDEFRENRIVELAVATDANHAINERRADRLRYASMLLLAGIVTHALVATVGVVRIG